MKNKSGTVKNSKFKTINMLKNDNLSKKTKAQIMWRKSRNSVVNIPIYFLLLAMSFVFLLPFVYMILQSMMSIADLNNSALVKWLPRSINFDSYKLAVMALNYWDKLFVSAWTTILAVLGQLISCLLVAYGLARLRFKGKGLIFGLVIFTLIVPPQVTIAPTFFMFSQTAPLGQFFVWENTFLPIIVPCFFAMGLSGGLFVFIYRQYFRSMPEELENAALIDGCGIFGSYIRIILPNIKAPVLVGVILSLVWQWNNYFEPNIFIKDKALRGNLPMQLELMNQNLASMAPRSNDAVEFAATFLVILPLIIVFFLLQNQFMKGIERVGLAN